MSKRHVNPGETPARDTFLVGDTDAETLHNIGCVLQVLSDAALSELSSPEAQRGWWLLLQEVSRIALATKPPA
ncbi:MAG: hypothetical protein RLO46_13120 [Pseudomonadales bacterium]